MIGYVYYGGSLPANADLGLKIAAPVGTFCGQRASVARVLAS